MRIPAIITVFRTKKLNSPLSIGKPAGHVAARYREAYDMVTPPALQQIDLFAEAPRELRLEARRKRQVRTALEAEAA